MAQTSPIIHDGILTYRRDGKLAQVAVDSSDWYAGLETASTFAFRSEHGRFIARKERVGNVRRLLLTFGRNPGIIIAQSQWPALECPSNVVHRPPKGDT